MIKSNPLSASPPGRFHASPPVSPTVTTLSSRNATPSPPDAAAAAVPESSSSTPAPLRPSSPPRSLTPSSKPALAAAAAAAGAAVPAVTTTSATTPIMNGVRPSGLAAEHNEYRAEGTSSPAAAGPLRPAMSTSASAPPGRLPLILSQDLSQYTDAFVPTAAVTPSSTSLAELAHLIRLQGYQEQRKSLSRVRLHRWLVSSALSARLVHCGELAHRTLVDHFRSDDKKSFAQLYNAIHDVRNSCDATRRYALLEPDLDNGRGARGGASRSDKPQVFSTFMHEIPPKIRDELLGFIAEVRTNPDFLAARLSSLSQQELASLTTFRQALEPIDAVMALQVMGKGVGQKQSRSLGANAVERLLSFQRHDPLSALIYTVFANSSGPDSAEDMRRTDAWAAACARLITEGKPGYDKFIKSVLDAFAGMREWPGKANLELYLMQVLQDGQFLLEKAEEQPTRPRTAPEVRSTKDTIAADEFYEKAVRKLFEVIDDEPSAGGIPEGAVEIGTAIMRRIEERKHRGQAQVLIVSRWFFSTYLLNAIIHPETQGIMTGHHISELARQKILKEIAIKAQKQVLDVMWNWKQANPVLPEIKVHVENILGRFKSRPSKAKPVLLPAKAITSPRETVEVQPFIVVCPSDIITLVNALFPERRPLSAGGYEKEVQRRPGLASGASSISGVSSRSIPFRSGSNSGDASSILSISASSMTSDTTSREPLLDDLKEKLPGPEGGADLQVVPKVAPTEEYGRKLRLACSEMFRTLGPEVCGGSCHPCAERWAVLYVSPDGKELKTRMRKDADDDSEHDEDSPDSDSEDEGFNDKIDLENDYHQLKDAIAKLVEEYEIPKELAPESETRGFSNRTSTHRRGSRQLLQGRSQSSEQLGTRNPYLGHSQLSNMIASQRAPPARHRSPQHLRGNTNADPRDPAEKPSVLVTMLEAAMNQCQARSDFVNAHLYYKTLQQLKKLQAPSLTRNGYSSLLNYFSRGPRDSLGKSASAIEEFEAWFVWLKQSQERHDTTINDMMVELTQLRDKMWYITDVRNSAGYEEARNVAIALKIMGQPTRTLDGRPIQQHRPRNFSRTSSNNFLLRTEAQVLDLMAASTDHGGPNKLADDQSDLTLRWLTQYGVENFCKGEERIHRFCLEVDKCVNKLVGDGILDGPVLWSSELYRRDKEILDSGRQKGDLFLTGVGTLSIAGDEEYETISGRPAPKSLDFAHRPSHGSLKAMAEKNTSQHSFESSLSNGRPVDIMDSQDYFGGSSPVLAIDASMTFWSPFQTNAQSPSSATNIRPRTSSSSKGTVMLKQSATVNDDKRRFLLDLKQALTGLLLSDLGAIVFGNGSETDTWFSSDLAEDCIQRKEEEDRRRKRLAKKKSMRSMKSARIDRTAPSERGLTGAPVTAMQLAATDQSAGEHSTSSSDATARSSLSAPKRAGLLEFPYNTAFRRLLRQFATHPSPYAKLHALYELELLIVASLSSRAGKSYASRRETLPTVPQSPTLGAVPELSSREPTSNTSRARNLEEAIGNCEKRRSQSMTAPGAVQASGPAPQSDTLAPRALPLPGARSPAGPPSTDMIVEVLQGLFRDADIRPKTLFRDLQYIASFVPAQMLDMTGRGKAFWDAGLAALGLKQDVCGVMLEIADEIIVANTQNRTASSGATAAATTSSLVGSNAPNATPATPDGSSASSTAGPSTSSTSPPSAAVAKYSMSDAARMLLITAKEGDAVAGRELAIFYLTHPDLLERTVLPLTRPRDVFKTELLRRRDDPIRSDPMTMCVAQHWMECSRRGGDQLAIKYLRQRDEMESIP